MAPQLSLTRHLMPGLWENEAFHLANEQVGAACQPATPPPHG